MTPEPGERTCSSNIAAVGKPSVVPLLFRRLLWVGLYVVLICGSFTLALWLQIHPQDSAARKVGRMLPLLGVPILALQPVLAARLKMLDQAFGLDVVYSFHKIMAMVAGSVLIAHPLVLASAGHWNLLTSLHAPLAISLGKVALLSLVAIVVTSLSYQALHLRLEQWRLTHNVLAVGILILAMCHSLVVGTDLSNGCMQAIWIGLAFLAAASYGWHKVLGPYRRKVRPFQVTQVAHESHNVLTITMAPSAGVPPISFNPGQFQFLTFFARGCRAEEHPFTISSSPAVAGSHSATIKESGDFTATIGHLSPGDRVAVQGPFGRFSYVLRPDAHDLVFIAGGIGITPLMSMLRDMRDEGVAKSVTLFYANRTEADIVFRKELEAMEGGKPPCLKVVHILSHASSAWAGARGRLGIDTIRRHVVDLTPEKDFYVCGPPSMMEAIMGELIDAGVPAGQIFAERFDL